MACKSQAADPGDYRINVLRYGPVGQPAIVEALSQSVAQESAIYCPKGVYLITNDLTLAAGRYLEFAPGCIWKISTNKVVTFNLTQFKADGYPHFSGGGMITGTVDAIDGCWPGWDDTIVANGGVYALTCLEDSMMDDYWKTTNALTGDLYGTLGTGAQIVTGGVTTVEILDNTMATNDINTNVWTFVGAVATNMFTYPALYPTSTNGALYIHTRLVSGFVTNVPDYGSAGGGFSDYTRPLNTEKVVEFGAGMTNFVTLSDGFTGYRIPRNGRWAINTRYEITWSNGVYGDSCWVATGVYYTNTSSSVGTYKWGKRGYIDNSALDTGSPQASTWHHDSTVHVVSLTTNDVVGIGAFFGPSYQVWFKNGNDPTPTYAGDIFADLYMWPLVLDP